MAMITLWAAAMYLVCHGAKGWYSLLCALPATFMSIRISIYILMAEEGFRLSRSVAYPQGSLSRQSALRYTDTNWQEKRPAPCH